MTHRVAVIAGDGAGPEVIAEARKTVDALGLDLEWNDLPWGTDHFHEHGTMMPPDALDVARAHDAILLGAVGAPVGARPRHALGPAPAAAAGTRPVREPPPRAPPRRRSRRSSRAARGRHALRAREHRGRVLGRRRPRAPGARARGRHRDERLHARRRAPRRRARVRARRAARAACSRARRSRTRRATATCSGTRSSRRCTPSHPGRDGRARARRRARRAHGHAPGEPRRRRRVEPLRRHPHRPRRGPAGRDGDGGEREPRAGRRRVAMFEPVHGSAPDIAGQGIANPLGAIWSARADARPPRRGGRVAQRLMAAIESVCRDGILTRDLGGSAGDDARSATRWQRACDATWWRDAVVYEIYVRSFADSNGDGVGDLAGIRAQLPYLARLGVDAIWLTPFFPSPGADHGYDVSDYVGVDPQFGTLADFDALLADAHARGIRVVIDLVPNHTSIEHPWFREHPEYYVWTDAPNNWLSVFGGPAWELDERARALLPPPLRARAARPRLAQPATCGDEFDDIYRFWLDRGVDGIRVDVAHGALQGPDARRRGRAGRRARSCTRSTGARAIDQPELHPYYRRLRALVDAYGDDRVPRRRGVLPRPGARRAVRPARRAAPGLQLHAALRGLGRATASARDRPHDREPRRGRRDAELGAREPRRDAPADALRRRRRGPAPRARRGAAPARAAGDGVPLRGPGARARGGRPARTSCARTRSSSARTASASAATAAACRSRGRASRPASASPRGSPWLPMPELLRRVERRRAGGRRRPRCSRSDAPGARRPAATGRSPGSTPPGTLVFTRGELVCAVNVDGEPLRCPRGALVLASEPVGHACFPRARRRGSRRAERAAAARAARAPGQPRRRVGRRARAGRRRRADHGAVHLRGAALRHRARRRGARATCVTAARFAFPTTGRGSTSCSASARSTGTRRCGSTAARRRAHRRLHALHASTSGARAGRHARARRRRRTIRPTAPSRAASNAAAAASGTRAPPGSGGRSGSRRCRRAHHAFQLDARPDGSVAARRRDLRAAPDASRARSRATTRPRWSPEPTRSSSTSSCAPRRGDVVRSYVAFRTVERDGTRLLLNGEPRCFSGVLDQAYWPDGVYTAPNADALRATWRRCKRPRVRPGTHAREGRRPALVRVVRRARRARRAGLAEPAPPRRRRGARGLPARGRGDRRAAARPSVRRHVDRHQRGLGRAAAGVPARARAARPRSSTRRGSSSTRPAGTTAARPTSSTCTTTATTSQRHRSPATCRSSVGECGGVSLVVGGVEDFAYKHVDSGDALAAEYARLVGGLGDVAGFVWTQLTDVEGELNGLLTHDRRPKAPPEAIRAANVRFAGRG